MARGFKSGGKQKGTKNKATLEREHRAMEALQQKSLAPLRTLAKDQLSELVPVVKGIVMGFQQAAMDSGAPGQPGYKVEFWRELRDWMKTYAQIADLAADFESPRYRAIAVLDATDGKMPFVVRAPAVMADSSAWQAVVGAAVIDMEAQNSPVVRSNEVAATLPAQTGQQAPQTAPVALMNDPKTNRITVMPHGPRVVQPVGSAEWLASIQKKVG